MTINKKGGKHKHKKRVRNNNPEERKNKKNIHYPSPDLGTYYGKVVKKLGGRGYLVKILHKGFETADNKGSKKGTKGKGEHFAKLRGSRQMKWKCPFPNVGSYVIVEIADYDNKKMIVWTYKDWEVDHLKKTKSIVDMDDEKNDDSFSVSFENNEDEEEVQTRPKSQFKDIYEELDFIEAQQEKYSKENSSKEDKIDISSI